MSVTKVTEAMIDMAIAETDEANVFTATQQIKSTDAGATAGPTLELYRDSASPAAADDIGQIAFQGEDSAGNLENYARLKAVVVDPTSTSEDAKLVMQTVVGGALAARVNVGGGLWTEGTTGGDPGAGKINVTELQVAGIAVTPVLQVVNTQSGAVATGTTVMPSDDTIPQNTEGDEYITRAITPKSATSRLRIDVVVHLAASVAGTLTAALFQDSTAGALAAGEQHVGAADQQRVVAFTHYMTSGTTSATTFKVRAGLSTAGTTTFNGAAGARLLGGVLSSSITISEIAA